MAPVRALSLSEQDGRPAAEPIRWNRCLSKAFDVTAEQFPARSAEEALVAKYLAVEIKYLERRAIRIPSVRMGAFLTAVNDVLRTWSVDDVRNLNYRGEETPPSYEVIQLNSTQSGDFLIDGMRFVRQAEPEGPRATLRVQPAWYGLDVTVYGLRSTGTAEKLLGQVAQRASEINFLKGEAFSLSGEFLPKTDETFADLFLDPKNAAALDRVVKLINTRGKALENRGVLLLGPPGTGKTLSARIVRNDAVATFIWVSSRDFHYAGSFGGFSQAFDLARECAPSVVVFEDIDNWLYDTTVDLIKTEMDGVSKSTGVVTMMTTNYPEMLPAALIDRPGRFHDVLKFDLPSDDARKQMLARWLPALTTADVQRAVKATAGYSGAHVKELARFATIIAEQDGLPLDQALTAALSKLAEQRELITATQRTGSRYRMPPELSQKSGEASLTRAYSMLQVKSVDAERRIITGIATTPSPDRIGDIVEPLGVEYTNPLPLLLYHDSKRPVGQVMFDPPTSEGITFRATIPEVTEPGTVKDRTDEAWHSLKYRLMAGFSIGFKEVAGEVERLKGGGLRYLKSIVLELSLVTIPMNQDAVLQTVKSLDSGPAALGTRSAVDPRRTPPGASGTTRVVQARTDSKTMKKTIAEQITTWEATRQAKSARMDEIMDKAADDGVTLDTAQKEEHDTLVQEVKDIDEHLTRLRDTEARNKSAAKPVSGDDPTKAAQSRSSHHVISVSKQTPPGTEFARYAMCLAVAKAGGPVVALEIARKAYPDETRIHEVLKAAVGAGVTSDATWAGSLVQYQDFAGDFIEFLRPMTILGKFGTNGIPSLRRVPFNIRVAGQTTGGSGYWVGEGKPKPLTKFGFTTVTLTWAKVANIAVLTEEEVRFSNPSAEAKVRDALAGALIERLDIDFIDPTKAAVANVSPASITNGVAAIPVTGTNAAAFRTDFKALMAPFIAGNISPTSAVLIMSATQALSLSLMLNALGQPEFPKITVNGGELMGIPVIVSEYLTTLGSPSTQMIVLVNASDIYLADDGQVNITASGEASLEMLDSALVQDGVAGTGASLVSLWQNNLLGLKAERFINWSKRRAAAAQYLSGTAYA